MGKQTKTKPMKTPKEEARQLAESIHPIWAMEDEDRTFDEIILANIPLSELLAVARAAAKKDSFLHAASTLSEKAMHDALQALRATGKVTI